MPRPRDFVSQADGSLIDVGWPRRAEAAERLADVPGDAAANALAGALNDHTPAVRSRALRSLADRGEPREGEMVSAAVTWDEEARESAEASLLEMADRDDASAQRLLQAYTDHAPAVTGSLSDAWIRSLLSALDDDARRAAVEAAMRSALAHPEEDVRQRQVLQAGEPLAIELLVAELAEIPSRAQVATLLGMLRNIKACEPLVGLLNSAQPGDRAAAAAALGQIQNPQVVEPLLRSTVDPVFAVRDAAQKALDAMGSAGMVWSVAAAARGALDGVAFIAGPQTRAALGEGVPASAET